MENSAAASKEECEEDLDDPIVRKMPVILNQALAGQLCILQHFNKPSYRNPHPISRVRMRPEHCVVECVYKVKRNEEFTHTSESISTQANFVVGVANHHNLVITPVKHLFKMKPSFKHLDAPIEDTLNATLSNDTYLPSSDTSSVKEKPTGEDASYDMPITTAEIKTTRGKRRGAYRYSDRESFYQYNKSLNEEKWINLKVYEGETEEGLDAIAMLESAKNVRVESTNGMLTPSEYLDKYAKNESASEDGEDKTRQYLAKIQGHVPLKAQLDRKILPSLTPRDRVLAIMKCARVVRFEDVAKLVRNGQTKSMSDREICRHLQVCAVLVHGSWVLKSEEALRGDPGLFDEAILHRTFVSDITKYEIQCRDFIVASFALSKDLLVRRIDLENVIKRLRAGRLEMMMKEVAQSATMDGERKGYWIFRKDVDASFVSKFPDLASKQRSAMESKYKKLKTALESNAEFASCDWATRKDSSMENEIEELDDVDGEFALTRSSNSGPLLPNFPVDLTPEKVKEMLEDPLPDYSASRLSNSLGDLLKGHPLLCKEYIQKVLVEEKGLTGDLDAALAKVAIEIPGRNGLYVLRDCGGKTVKREMRAVLCYLFGKTKCVKRQDVKRVLTKIYKKTPDKVKVALASNNYMKTIKEFATSSSNRWHIRSGDPNAD